MHDFDIDRAARYEEDRTFKIGGETFTHRPTVRPERMAAYEEMPLDITATEATKLTDDLIVAWLDTTNDPDAVDRYRKLREREDDPIGGGDLSDIIRWLYRQSTRRPTQSPAPSSDGSGATGTTSTETSSSEPAGGSKVSASESSAT